MKNKADKHVAIYPQFEDENEAEHLRLAKMTGEERLAEFALIQKRVWGEQWPNFKMEKTATWEKVDW